MDTDFLVWAVTYNCPERAHTWRLLDQDEELQISVVTWYEFCRGPRTPDQLAVARCMFGEDGIIPFSEDLAAVAADVFRSLGSPRKRAADVVIGVTAASLGARLLTRNTRDFAGIPGLQLESAPT